MLVLLVVARARGARGVLGLRPRTGAAMMTPWTQRVHTRPKTPWCEAHMNELPVPCGSWGQYYKRQQDRYNKWLYAGILWFVFSALVMVGTDSFFANWSPPAVPAPHQHSHSVFEPEDTSMDHYQPMHSDDPDPCAE